MTVELFLGLLLLSVVINIPLVEFMKRVLAVANMPYRRNILPFYTSITVCTGIGVVYRIPFGLGFEIVQVVRLVILIVFTWYMSMQVYDKIVQTKKQHRKYVQTKKKGEKHHA